MNPAFVLAHLIAGLSYPAAVAAELVGLLPLNVFSFPAFVSFYVAGGVVAIAVRDYSRPGTTRRRAARPASRVTDEPRRDASVLEPVWHVHTVSA